MVKLAKFSMVSLLGLMVVGLVVTQTQLSISAPLPLPSAITSQSTAVQKPRKVVFFGSSSTVGFGTTRGDHRWTTLISRYFGWQEVNEGLSGSTISTAAWPGKPKYLESGVERWRRNVLSRRPDRVMMLYGVNDAFRQIPLGAADQPGTFNGDTTKMLTEMAKELRPHQLISISPQPNEATWERRAAYDAGLLAATQKVGAYFIDGQAAFPKEDLPGYAADGLHLNDLGHAAFASYVANKMVELGLEPAPPNAQGGNQLAATLQALPSNKLLVDQLHPLTFGRLKTIEIHGVANGHARLAVARPNGRGGYELLYRTPILEIVPGVARIAVPNWWVLAGDRLAIWSKEDCLGGLPLADGQVGLQALPELNATMGQDLPAAIAIRTID